ncbi:HD domain-containing protein [Sutcliffiella deserti]|uniref:HD domain-containing protein n=1 Tax=Sutcliffiella deserti TaxID=2875501 RepID=UPI001CBA7C6B|nr:HD domain-containing protein [Sutcliffiella deserti]
MIETVEAFVRSKFQDDTTGHDWHHIFRVRKLALHIAKQEDVDSLKVELIALLHDVIDDKLILDKDEAHQEVVSLLRNLGMQEKYIEDMIHIIENIGYKGGNGLDLQCMESRIVQDADRLDAIGAVGIARTFMYSGAKSQAMYDPDIPVRDSMSYEQYRKEKSTAINHFHEKLFLLKETLHTKAAKEIAEERHKYMENFVEQFMKEWNEI